ncbi:MAG: hypothetical protein KC910_12840, partial [Candidatus Eremiobacteraeota bacterium]|nr:hypothetical protein [Candidatus Eremiobacteraeota bacterium]
AYQSRSTRDLKVLTVLSEDDMEKFILAARDVGFSHHPRADRHPLDEVTLYRFWLPVRETGLSTSLDLQVGSSEFHLSVIARAASVTLAGVRVKLATREDLILMKLVAFRPIDRADAIDLATGADLDKAYLELWVERLGLGERWREVCAALEL